VLSRRARSAPRGAASLLVLLACWLLVVAGLGGAELLAVSAAEARAELAAAAAAHAAEVALAGQPDAGALSVELQAGRTACRVAEEPDAPALCGPATRAARRVARADGAEVVDVVLGPDPRDRVRAAAPGRIVAVATVEMPRGLPLLGRLCADPRLRSGVLCLARATAAARLA
jgi:pyruvate/2-oxoglutarate dehydrogenase complex dihydrolipoamide acyltransferase (E2) component